MCGPEHMPPRRPETGSTGSRTPVTGAGTCKRKGLDPVDPKLQGLHDTGQQQEILEESQGGSSIDSVAEADQWLLQWTFPSWHEWTEGVLWYTRETLQIPHRDFFYVVLFLIFMFLVFFWGRIARAKDRYKRIGNWGALYKIHKELIKSLKGMGSSHFSSPGVCLSTFWHYVC